MTLIHPTNATFKLTCSNYMEYSKSKEITLRFVSFTFLSSHLQTVAADVAATRMAKHRRNALNS